MDKYGIWSEDQHDVLQVFTKEFNRRFEKDPDAVPHQDIPLLRDISTDNEWLTREPTEDEIELALKAPRSDGMHVISIRNAGI